MKLLQIIIILCSLAGSTMGLDLLFRPQDPGVEVTRPCLDENGEPTC